MEKLATSLLSYIFFNAAKLKIDLKIPHELWDQIIKLIVLSDECKKFCRNHQINLKES